MADEDEKMPANDAAATPTEDKGKGIAPPPPASVVLPLTFQNSFWSQDYRTGFEALYTQLEAGTIQSGELIAQIQKRALAERNFANDLHPPALRPDGFGIDEGASLKMGLEALLTSAVQESRAHAQLAEELTKSIAAPFEEWSDAHKGRIKSSRALVEAHLVAYEKKLHEVTKLKAQYDEACRVADMAEDQLTFSRGTANSTPANGSPRLTASAAKIPDPLPASPTSAPVMPSARIPTETEEKSTDASGEEAKTASDTLSKPTLHVNNDDPHHESSDEENTSPLTPAVAQATAAFSRLGRSFTTLRKKAAAAVEPSTPPLGGPTAAGGAGGVKDLPDAPSAEPNVVDLAKVTFNSLFERVAGPQTGEGKNDKARKDAEVAEEKYKNGVEALDNARLQLEETLSEHFAYTHRCESDRVKAATSVLRSFHATVAGLGSRIQGSAARVATTLQLIRPERDVLAVIERSKTGPFQPRPTPYTSHYSEPPIHAFGIDLRKFDETNTSQDKVPPILTFLLEYVSDHYPKIKDDQQRKAWLYETPLAAQHHLRSALNRAPKFDRAVVDRYDLPVIVSVIKLWLLELDVPTIIYTHYDEYRALYPKRVGAEIADVPTSLIASHIARLPPVHLAVLRALIEHFSKLLATTKTEESDEVYLQKLALSVARCIIRPKVETSLTLDDRFPTLLFIDLVRSYSTIFASADELKTKQREDRYKPRRQRTKPVDVRMTRAQIASGVGAAPPVPSLKVPALPVVHEPEHPSETSLAASPMSGSPVVEQPPVRPSTPPPAENGPAPEEETTPTAKASTPEIPVPPPVSTVNTLTPLGPATGAVPRPAPKSRAVVEADPDNPFA